MHADDFRRIALGLQGAEEGAHRRHPDFRIGTRIFATLGYPDAAHGMVKLTPEQQELFMRVAPETYSPSAGAWGRGGSTLVKLDSADAAILGDAIRAAWHGALENIVVTKPAAKKVAAKKVATKGGAAARGRPHPGPLPQAGEGKKARTKQGRTR